MNIEKAGRTWPVILAAALAAVSSLPIQAQEPLVLTDSDIANTGHVVFVAKCAVCHGKDGRGTGPYAAQLTTRPADLTVLSKNNKGQFPFWRVYETISGTELLPAHGSRDMPIWGQELATEAAGMDKVTFVRGRILELIAWLRRIQKD